MENAAYSEKDRIARQMEAIEGRFEELSIRITLPEVIADTALFQKLMREHSDMEELATAAKAYGKLRRHIEEAQEMADGDDPDMAEMAREELTELNAELDKATAEARLLLLPRDPDDRRNAIIEVRAGAGGDEAGLFGAELVRMYAHYAAARGWKPALRAGRAPPRGRPHSVRPRRADAGRRDRNDRLQSLFGAQSAALHRRGDLGGLRRGALRAQQAPEDGAGGGINPYIDSEAVAYRILN